jgi:hypothetical protein
MRVAAVARDPARTRAHAPLFDAVVLVAKLHEVLGEGDAFVVAVPHTAETEEMIDAAAFAAVRLGLAFVNIGCGQIVDKPALIGVAQRPSRLCGAGCRPGRTDAAREPALVHAQRAHQPAFGQHGAAGECRLHRHLLPQSPLPAGCRPDGMRDVLDPELLY